MWLQLIVSLPNSSVSHSQRKAYVDKLFPAVATYQKTPRNQGVIIKFNNAIGYKGLVSQRDNHESALIPPISSPETYLPPADFLFERLAPSFEGDNLFTFTVPSTRQQHPCHAYSYDPETLLDAFGAFLQKVFPSCHCQQQRLTQLPHCSTHDRALHHFFLTIHPTIPYHLEVSAASTLTSNEKSELIQVLESITAHQLDIEQYECETCHEHSLGAFPYHLEVRYLAAPSPLSLKI